jgi:hypothetical protein
MDQLSGFEAEFDEIEIGRLTEAEKSCQNSKNS